MKRLFATALALAAGCATVPVETDDGPVGGRAEIVGEVARPPRPEGLSGITWLSGNSYLTVNDSGGLMYPMTVTVDPVRKVPMSVAIGEKVRLEGVDDGEGIAYDPLCGTVWVSDETGPRVTEHEVRTGRRLRELALPPVLKRCRVNLSLESLTIAPDGRTLWTANEEALDGDGPVSTAATGTVVRLFRYVRSDASEMWRPAGQFAYRTDPVGGRRVKYDVRSGVSDLCLLPDGRLLVLERELSAKGIGIIPSFRMRIYTADVSAATDVTPFDRLEGRDFTPVAKRLLTEANTGFSMYEGICLGPRLSDGSRILTLVSDGDGPAFESVLSIRLY